MSDSLSLFYFFFQAEDGIRDLTVTGVQTCALPIFHQGRGPAGPGGAASCTPSTQMRLARATRARRPSTLGEPEAERAGRAGDRESGVEGKRVDLGGRRIIKKKKRGSNRRRENGVIQ